MIYIRGFYIHLCFFELSNGSLTCIRDHVLLSVAWQFIAGGFAKCKLIVL